MCMNKDRLAFSVLPLLPPVGVNPEGEAFVVSDRNRVEGYRDPEQSRKDFCRRRDGSRIA